MLTVKLELFGSFATGLCLPWSDIDIVLDIEQDRVPS
jgi:non-canonical poly(A) RNA polymerase PAPD5/7